MNEKARLNHLYATVGDLATARAFWTQVIGLDLLYEDDEYLRLAGEGGFSMGMERVAEGDTPELEVVVRVVDVDATYERVRRSTRGHALGCPPDLAAQSRRSADQHLLIIRRGRQVAAWAIRGAASSS